MKACILTITSTLMLIQDGPVKPYRYTDCLQYMYTVTAGRGRKGACTSERQQRGVPRRGVIFCDTKYTKKFVSSVEARMDLE